MRPLLPLALAALALPAACRRSDGPADRYRAFAEAARAGDDAAVWEALSNDSRATLDVRAKEVSAQAPAGVVPASGRELVLGDLAADAPRVKSAGVLRESADAAVVLVEDEAGGKAEVMLVREGGAWRVVVPGLATPPR